PVLTVEVTGGPHAGLSVGLAGHGTFTIGRQPGLHVTLERDIRLSRVHCVIELAPGGARLTDLRTSWGTFVNGARISNPHLLAATDEVRVGDTRFRVRVSGPPDGSTVSVGGTAPLREMPTRPPVIPGLVIGEELGRGNMGVVYRAAREADGEVIAVKTILPAVAPTPAAVGRFCREADVLGRLAHPNVVGYRGSGA